MSNGLCPFAEHKIIPPGANDPAITPRVAILHVDAGNAESLHTYFRDRSGGIESHFHVRRDGVIEQYRDIYHQADANHNANDFAVSIETQGYGEGEWTPAQIDSIKQLLTWLHRVADIPLRKVQRWDGSGVGYHVQFGAPGAWTPVAKSCPGRDRIRQFNNVLVPWMASAEGDEMAEYGEELAAIRNGVQWIVNRLKADAAIRVNLQRLLKQGKATKAELQELSDAFEAAQK